ncbi:hypothetical protein B9Y01_09610 [Acinetobacter baumannii]|nr:hypothetical protein B7L44_15825 [Acinetobacter nosocomialis]KRI55751.1 hypothetical protein APD18_10615 [Acinetobacter baumannii]RSN77111.1 hypothetical protein EA769_06295 [Acinetobacter haemolyticus]TNL53821.1 hypothetical protein EYB59_02265 [Acinetobacter bereziniae]AZC01987.1 hypothetical protein DKC18_004355 [Acinetobacter nosocomialis]
MVAEQKRVDRLGSKEPAHPKVSPFCPTIKIKEGREGPQKIGELFSVLDQRSVKTDWQCRPASPY